MNYQTPLSKLADSLNVKRETMNHATIINTAATAASQRIEQLENKLSSTIAIATVMAQELQELTEESQNLHGVELLSTKALIDVWEALYQEQNLINEVTV